MSIFKPEKCDNLCDPEVFAVQLHTLAERVAALHHPAAAANPDELNQRALAELSCTIEELRAAQEEMARQRAELHEAHANLEFERERYKGLFDSAPNAYLVTNSIARIHEANDAAVSMLQVRRDFLLGSTLGSYIAADCRREFRDRLSQGLAAPQHMPQTWETVIERGPGGSSFEAELTVAFSGNDERDNLLWIVRDLTARKRLERMVQQSERLAGLGQMIASFAHESGNSLQRSQAALEMLASSVTDRPRAVELVSEIERANDDLIHLQKCIKDYASPVRLAKSSANLADVLQAAWHELHLKLAGRDARFIAPQRDGLHCDIDRAAMQQVFRNILENSLAACADPVVIKAGAQACELEGQPAVRITICDNGPGLSPGARERVFEPFFSTRAKGMGLGMAIVKRIVEAHWGRVEIDRQLRHGAGIIIEIPRGQP